jgi:hypothetical protein
MSDDSSMNEILAILLLQDGYLRYGRIHNNSLEDLLVTEILDDSGLTAILEMNSRDTLDSLLEPDAQGLFTPAPEQLSKVISGIGIANGHYATPSMASIGTTLSALQKQPPQTLDGEFQIHDQEGGAILLHDILDLEICCNSAGSDDKKQESCRHLYWQLWEFAWTRRIFITDDHTVEALENLFSRYPFLDSRNGGQLTALQHGNLPNPVLEEDLEPELW